MSALPFSTLSLSQAVLTNLTDMGYTHMTAVQAMSLPHVLQNKDVIAQAKTGSGKTAAFGIGLLNKIQLNLYQTQALVLCPTRELADQVSKELRRLARFTQNIKIMTLCGGTSLSAQARGMSHPAHVVVGTPGRLLKHLQKGNLHIDTLQTLVLDEADRMLDMGFIQEIQELIDFVPKKRQTLLFSATFTDEIRTLSARLQNNAVSVETLEQEQPNPIDEYFYALENGTMPAALLNALAHFQIENCLVFVNTKVEVEQLVSYLNTHAVEAAGLHGDMEQYQRNDVLVKFANQSVSVLVATDVAARGLDIKQMPMVINYGLPYELTVYTHRIGRTARAGLAGIALTIYAGKQAHKANELFATERKNAQAIQLKAANGYFLKATNATLVIEAGKKDKLRAGDILGALAKDVGIAAANIGKIDIYDKQSYVALHRSQLNQALQGLKNHGIKGKRFSVWLMK